MPARAARRNAAEAPSASRSGGARGISERALDLLALDEALERLSSLDSQLVRIVEMRFIAGMSVEETGEALSVSPTTVKRDSALARAWLLKELTGGGSGAV